METVTQCTSITTVVSTVAIGYILYCRQVTST